MTNFIWEMMYFSTMTNLAELRDCMRRWMEVTVITGGGSHVFLLLVSNKILHGIIEKVQNFCRNEIEEKI